MVETGASFSWEEELSNSIFTVFGVCFLSTFKRNINGFQRQGILTPRVQSLLLDL